MLHEKDTNQNGDEVEHILVSIDYVPAKTYYDLDADMSVPFNCAILGTVEAIKCDGEYFLVPEGSDDLAKVVVDDNRTQEVKVLGTEGILKKYFADLQHETIEAV